MTPFWQDDHLTLYGGDCRAVLAEMPAESVHCVVTSPPYWGLRDYGTATWDGGDPACSHSPLTSSRADRPANGLTGGKATVDAGTVRGGDCRCGARRIDSQLGLEPTPEEYVANMVAVFREVRRVLRADGTLWLNLGDAYAQGHGGSSTEGKGITIRKANRGDATPRERVDVDVTGWSTRDATPRNVVPGYKPKDLMGMPWRVAFALQADGWYLRSDIIWAKPNPMPESVTDRPTKAHEYLFLLSKSPRYYFDNDAVREASTLHPADWNPDGTRKRDSFARGDGGGKNTDPGKEPFRAITANRNLRSVWTIATEPYPGAHFATFPRKLVEPCVKAGTSERGVCPECGAPWVRVVERTAMVLRRSERTHPMGQTRSSGTMVSPPTSETTGWRPTCDRHGHLIHTDADGRVLEPVPAVVLDPFAGSGTTLLVAQSLGRRGVGIDLNPEYLRQALERNRQTPLGLVG